MDDHSTSATEKVVIFPGKGQVGRVDIHQPLQPRTPLQRWRDVRALSLPSVPKAVLLDLAYHAGASWPTCWPSIETLAEGTGLGERSVNRALRTLKATGYVSVKRQRRDVSIYTLHIPPAPLKRLSDVSSTERERGGSLKRHSVPKKRHSDTLTRKNQESRTKEVGHGEGSPPRSVRGPRGPRPAKPNSPPVANLTHEQWVRSYDESTTGGLSHE